MKNKQHKKISLQKLTITKLPKTTIENVHGGSSIPPTIETCIEADTDIFKPYLK